MASSQCRAWLVVFGGVSIHITLGTLYCFGNLKPYFASHIVNSNDSSSTYHSVSEDLSFVFAATVCAQALSMPIGGVLERRVGPRLCALIGCVLMLSGCFLSYFTCASLYGLLVTYGILFGSGTGIAYCAPMVAGFRWLPKVKGTVTGIVVAGFGAGALVFNQVETHFINPDNAHPRSDGSFPKEVSDRVPNCFLLLGSIYAALQLIGLSLLVNPPGFGGGEPAEEKKEEPSGALTSSGGNFLGRDQRVICSGLFWVLFVTFFLNGISNVFVSTDWKNIGLEKEIGDDSFLSIVGSVSSLFNASGRIILGASIDKIGYSASMAALSALYFALLLTLPFIGVLSEASFFVYICGVFLCLGGNFAVFPSTLSLLFGAKNVGRNYGLLFISQIPGSLLGAFALSQGVVSQIPADRRWLILSIAFSVPPALSVALTALFARMRRAAAQDVETQQHRTVVEDSSYYAPLLFATRNTHNAHTQAQQSSYSSDSV